MRSSGKGMGLSGALLDQSSAVAPPLKTNPNRASSDGLWDGPRDRAIGMPQWPLVEQGKKRGLLGALTSF